MSIQGGFETNIYQSQTKTGAASHVGITTNISPVVEPNNIDARGTGRRGLYNVLLGMIEPQITLDLALNDKDFLTDYQDGQTAIPFLHLKSGSIGITYTNAYINRVSVTARHGELLEVTVEIWAEVGEALAAASWGNPSTVPYRWLDTVFSIDAVTETQWWEWRYDINNNLQRLGDVDSGGTREIVARHRNVSGSLVKDLRSWSEFTDMMNTSSETALVAFLMQIDSTTVINSDGRWGRIEAPTGSEDLIAKRFPFTLLDVS
jgi:hypothetical protein